MAHSICLLCRSVYSLVRTHVSIYRNLHRAIERSSQGSCCGHAHRVCATALAAGGHLRMARWCPSDVCGNDADSTRMALLDEFGDAICRLPVFRLNPFLRYESQPLASNKRFEREVMPSHGRSADCERTPALRRCRKQNASERVAARRSNILMIRSAKSEWVALGDVRKAVDLGIYLNKSFQLADLFPSTTPAAADACISAMLSLAVVKSRGPLSADGTDCSTLRSTKGLNGASSLRRHSVL